MTDQFGPSDPPVRRGRRNPQLLDEIERAEGVVTRRPDPREQIDMVPLGDDHLADNAEGVIDDGLLLLPGDIIALKVTHEIEGQYGRSWVAYGIQTRVMEGESEEDAFVRVTSQVNTRVLDAAADSAERVADFAQEQAEQQAHRPIQPQRR